MVLRSNQWYVLLHTICTWVLFFEALMKELNVKSWVIAVKSYFRSLSHPKLHFLGLTPVIDKSLFGDFTGNNSPLFVVRWTPFSVSCYEHVRPFLKPPTIVIWSFAIFSKLHPVKGDFRLLNVLDLKFIIKAAISGFCQPPDIDQPFEAYCVNEVDIFSW